LNVLALVEIGTDRSLLIVSLVFVITFVVVVMIAYLLLVKGRATDAGWRFELQTRLPVSKPTFDRIANATVAGMRPPKLTAATRQRLDSLTGTRRHFVTTYRVVMLLIGVAGLAGAVALLRSHTPANMNGLPGGIVLLLSLGALLNGLIPPRSVVPIEPLSGDSLREIKNKFDIQVVTSEPLRVELNESQMQLGAEMHRQGAPPVEIARAVYARYDTLSDSEKRAVEEMIVHAARR
jgi:hypothetical protein